jgi:hypothetical protein
MWPHPFFGTVGEPVVIRCEFEQSPLNNFHLLDEHSNFCGAIVPILRVVRVLVCHDASRRRDRFHSRASIDAVTNVYLFSQLTFSFVGDSFPSSRHGFEPLLVR